MINDDDLAKKILEVIPPSMGRIRSEMRSFTPMDLSIPQYRILGSIFRGTTLAGELAKIQGVSQPAMSMMIDSLVEKGFVQRNTKSADRRQIPLMLTQEGESLYLKIRKATQLKLSQKISELSNNDRTELNRGLIQLEKIFSLENKSKKNGDSKK